MAATLPEDEIRRIALNGANLVPRQIGEQSDLQHEVARYHMHFLTRSGPACIHLCSGADIAKE